MIDLQSALHANEFFVPSIYETAVDPNRWDEVLATTSEFLGAARSDPLAFLLGKRSRKGHHIFRDDGRCPFDLGGQLCCDRMGSDSSRSPASGSPIMVNSTSFGIW